MRLLTTLSAVRVRPGEPTTTRLSSGFTTLSFSPLFRAVPHFLVLAFLIACSSGTSSSGGGQDRLAGLNQADREAFALIPGGFQGKWLKGSRAIERRDIPVGGAYPDGLIVLGRDTLGQPVTWIAGVLVHEAKHHRDGRPCSLEGEKRAIERQIEFDLTIGGNHVKHLEGQIGVHDCP